MSSRNVDLESTRSGSQLIASERARQKRAERYTAQHDDSWDHKRKQLAAAAHAYLANYVTGAEVRFYWPWADGCKPTPDDPIRQLTKAGALIAAEIDRLQRLK